MNPLRSQASDPALRRILDRPDSFRFQIIYTRIDRDRDNHPHFHHYYYRVNPLEYFNPASTVKMPLSFLALEKMDSLSRYGIDKFTPMLTDSAYSGQTAVHTDSSAASGLPSLAQYIKKVFLVSDNDAYNHLYEFLGQQYLNERLWQLGYKDIRITRRFFPMNEDENRHTQSHPVVRAAGQSTAAATKSPAGGSSTAGPLLYEQSPAFSHV